MKNVNLFLQSARRSDLFGYNMASIGREDLKRVDMYPDQRRGGAFPEAQWDLPRPGMHGVFVLGHHTDIVDALALDYTIDGVEQKCLKVTRNQWTPAYMDTIYRCAAQRSVYPHSGVVTIRERKAITRQDVYIAHVRLQNERREPIPVRVAFRLPFSREGDVYRVETVALPGALMRRYPIGGYMALAVSEGQADGLTMELPALGDGTFRYAMAFSPVSPEDARIRARQALAEEEPFAKNEAAFNAWFALRVPRLDMENQDFLKSYYYRWFVVYRSIHNPRDIIPQHEMDRPCMYESPAGGWYGAPVGLPVPWQIEEAKWMRRGDDGWSHLENWAANRGAYQAYIQFVPWTAWQAYQMHPDRAWLRAHYAAFKQYITERINLSHPVPTVTRGSWGTGAEYQPAFYQYTPNEPWDWRYDVEGQQSDGLTPRALYRLDDLCYHVLSLRGCAHMAKELGETEDERAFRAAAEAIARVVREQHWDRERGFFFDRDAATGLRCDQAAGYDGFAPFMDGIAGEEYAAAFDWLDRADGFAADFAAPTVARSCPMFWYDNCIAGPSHSSPREPHDYGCSWNGPVWPYANSIIAMGLGEFARTKPEYRARWLKFFTSWTELHFPGGDRGTPLVCEHYRCDDGATFSIANDYFHSSWINPFLTFFLGVQARDGRVEFDPFTDEDFLLEGVVIGEKVYAFSQRHENGERKLSVDGKAWNPSDASP